MKLVHLFGFITKKNIVLSVILYLYKTWRFILGYEPRLWVFDSRVLRLIWAQERCSNRGVEKTTQRKAYVLCFIGPLKSRKMRRARRVLRVRQSRVDYNVLVGKRGGKRPLGRPRRKCEGNLKINI